jgi:transposase
MIRTFKDTRDSISNQRRPSSDELLHVIEEEKKQSIEELMDFDEEHK